MHRHNPRRHTLPQQITRFQPWLQRMRAPGCCIVIGMSAEVVIRRAKPSENGSVMRWCRPSRMRLFRTYSQLLKYRSGRQIGSPPGWQSRERRL